MKKCDIIIPIYNAYDCVIECIESVLKNTNFDNNGLILINDQSTDKRIAPLLNKYKKNYPFIEIIHNSENLGFVGSVNRGMKQSKNDVVLLNSDTEVTKDWIEKLKKFAYKSPNIATVTPLSNNATLASVPNIFEPNDLPKNMNLDEMQNIIDKASYKDIVEIPTGHGFCLYIKRSIIDEIGYFNEKDFGKGYGEENEFCFRCLDAGYINVLCDNVYILHKESKSFKEEKKELILQGSKVLQEKFPEYKDRLDLWCQKKEISYIGQSLSLMLGTTLKAFNILFVIHDWKDIKKNLGGTSLHAWDIISNLRGVFNFHVLTPEEGNYKLYSYWANNNAETILKFPGVEQFAMLPFHNFKYREMIEKIVEMFKIDLVHVHHLIGNYFDLFDVLFEKNIYTIMTLHDYYTVCPTINKLYKNESYCETPDNTKCSNCLISIFKNNKRASQAIISWRRNWQAILQKCNLLIAPSQSAKEEINKTYKDLDIKVIEHGVNIKKIQSTATLTDNEIVDIAFIGAIGIHKGAEILEQLTKTKKLKNVRIHLFGKTDRILKSTNKFINHGKYLRSELPDLLKSNNIKIICLFSIWPETYSYTLTESIACGIPVLAFNFGAIAERIQKYGLGWTIPYNSNIESIIYAINKIADNCEGYSKIIDNINKYKIKTTKQMANEYESIYRNAISKQAENVDIEEIKKAIKDSTKQYSHVSYSNYEWVFDTLKWKIISKIKLPKSIKKLLRR